MTNIKNKDELIDVWKCNLKEETKRIKEYLDKGYTMIALDTEFPGIYYRHRSYDKSNTNNKYQEIKLNVDNLKPIQVGITIMKPNSTQKSGFLTWQFNLDFNVYTDTKKKEAIKMLKESGIDFDKMVKEGIDLNSFKKALEATTLLNNQRLTWVTFHGGYDFAYLIKVITKKNLPDNSNKFVVLCKQYFPYWFDVKVMLKAFGNLRFISLKKLANHFNIRNEEGFHQAGFDSFITGRVFLKMIQDVFKGNGEELYLNKIYEINTKR